MLSTRIVDGFSGAQNSDAYFDSAQTICKSPISPNTPFLCVAISLHSDSINVQLNWNEWKR